MCFYHGTLSGKPGEVLQGQKGVPLMIEHAKEEHDIERSLEGSEVTPLELQARPQEASGHSKALPTLQFYPILASDKVPVLEVINRRHRGAAAFTPEREESIPTANV